MKSRRSLFVFSEMKRRSSRWLLIVLLPCWMIAFTSSLLYAQRGVYKATITPHWIDEAHFWYRNDLPDRRQEYVLVDAQHGVRKPAFDHRGLAETLTNAGVKNARADRLQLEELEFDLPGESIAFRAAGRRWRCGLETYNLRQLDDSAHTDDAPAKDPEPESLKPMGAPRRSARNGVETEIVFVNPTPQRVELFWLDGAGRRRSYGKLDAHSKRRQHTYAGHVWEVVDDDGATRAVFEAVDDSRTAVIPARPVAPQRIPRERAPDRRGVSPDGKWRALVRDQNVFLQALDKEADGEKEVQLSHDGGESHFYDRLEWSPDGRTLVAFRVEPGEQKQVHLLESSPDGGGRAKLHSRAYPLPGDKFAAYELNLFRIEDREQIKPQVERIDFGRPRLRWRDDGRRFTYEKTDRGHQRFRVIEIDTQDGAARNILDEQTETFIFTYASAFGPLVRYIDKTEELIYASERDGWRHLYLVDVERGEITRQITRGAWVVRGIDRIDEDKRQIWFRASGRHADQDPYFMHHYRIDFDGRNLVALTAANGDHEVQFSPDRRFLIDTYSRVDMPPVHELRRVSDGVLLCELERADIGELQASGWIPPEVFSAKGRDGETDIWGIVCRPRDFDPDKKYPVIEAIYAGPHNSHVPKSFSASRLFSSLTDLGFVVAKIDGMGTANRSKAFHDVCWHNLQDAGFPDRILWHKAFAAKHPWYDITRVGIYGGSAGGQNSTGALLFHGDFYDVAVSSCGCHDNRLDKASWNEQWMGYPVGPHYAQCSNIENAHRLRGKLMLIVGEMDTNVPPESTLRLADALIKADKDFDLVYLPGVGHGDGGRYGERRRQDFFRRHLLGKVQP
ncbi:MAG: prolyl oligopeptidase family serine peptidase [Pirellulaceae bacterium]